MKNTLTINHLNSGSVDLVNRVNSGTNEFLLEVTGGNGATITFDGGNAVSVTSDDFIYSVSSSLWVGSNSLSINISDGTISYTLTVNKIDQLTGDIYIQKDSDTEFTLVKKEDSKRELLDFFYPVGSYYESSDTTFDPNITWGGTWELETEGLVHISSGENYTVSSDAQDGGAKQIKYTPAGTNTGGTVQGHTLTANQSGIQSHTHTMQGLSSNDTWYPLQFGSWYSSGTNRGSINFHMSSGVTNQLRNSSTSANAKEAHSHGFTPPTFTGTEATLDNMQPYKVVNRWHRTA